MKTHSPRPWRRRSATISTLAALALAILAMALAGPVRAAGTGKGKAAESGDPALRFLPHVSTDKPIYRAGEKVYVRAVVLNAFDNTPMLENLYGSIEILSPKGSPAATAHHVVGENGAIGWAWEIPEGTVGGDYTVKVIVPGMAPAEREINVRAYRAPRMRTQIEFLKEGYSPSDDVVATLEVSRTEGGVPVGAEVDIVARVDQREIHRSMAKVGADGVVTARFALPETIAFGDGTLVFNVRDGGVVEPASKTIPILLSHVDLAVYPEGGSLVSDVPNRVYFEAIAPNGRPADIVAELKDGSGRVLLTAKAEHEGRGSFEFTPAFGETYSLEVVEPWTVTTKTELPEQTLGVAMHADQEVVAAGEALHLMLSSPRARGITIVVSERDRQVAELIYPLAFEAGARLAVSLPLNDDAAGVLRVTVLETAGGTPLAERLVFRRPKHELEIELDLDRDAYVPGDHARVIVRATRNGAPAQAFVGLTVTDDGTLEMIENRKKAPRLPVQVFVEPEVRDLADATIYLSDDEGAPRALDLLLGTQGWRRFAWISRDEFISKYGDDARRVFAAYARPVPARYLHGFGAGGQVDLFFHDGAVPPPGPMPMNAAKVLPVVRNGEGGEPASPEEEWKLGIVDRNGFILGSFGPDADQVVGGDLVGELNNEDKRADLKEKDDRAEPVQAQRRLGRENELVAEQAFFADMDWAASSAPMSVPVRVYAHKARPDRNPDDRVDFTETIYWSSGIATDANGHAAIEFDLSDSVTSFRVMADAWSKEGTLGAADAVLESRRPFYVEVKSPLEVTAGDTIGLVATIVNETDDTIDAAIACSAQGGLVVGEHDDAVSVAPHSRVRVLIPATATATTGTQQIIVTASGGGMTDHVTRTVSVAPFGFPVAIHESGMLEGEVAHRIEVPQSVVAGSLTATVAVYPTPLANMTEAIESLIRDPYGCFEQASSTNYPLTMAMQYFATHEGVDPELVRTTKEKLGKGYELLTGYECGDNGYEWFGANPPHEALTAYGLLEFTDMAEVHPVDPAMLWRTRAWLMDRRDGRGGFMRDSKALDSFGRAPEDATNAYILWALCGAGERELAKELDAALGVARTSKDPYVVALTAGALQHAGRGPDAAPLLAKLAGMQGEDGSLAGAKTSITGSGGQALALETASLAVLAWLGGESHAGNVEKAMRFIGEQCKGGRFGSTQSTILALKAIVKYDASRAAPRADGEVILTIDGAEAGSVSFKKETKGTLEIAGFGGKLTPGTHELKLRMRDGSPMPYALTIDFHAERPRSAAECVVELETEIVDDTVNEGEATEILARVRNASKNGQGMTVAVIGLPGGLEPRHEQLQESVEEGAFDFYEIAGRDVILYWREMAPETEHNVTISVLAASPGTFRGPASRAWLYYTDEFRMWTDPLEVTVTAAE